MELKSYYRIRFGDCDPFQHLHNARYVDYMLDAREDHLREHYQIDITELYRKGLSWMVNSHEILYLRPALYNEVVCISSTLLKAGDDILLVEMLMTDEQRRQVKALLRTRFIHVDPQAGKRTPHPEWFLELIRPMEDLQAARAVTLKERLAALSVPQS